MLNLDQVKEASLSISLMRLPGNVYRKCHLAPLLSVDFTWRNVFLYYNLVFYAIRLCGSSLQLYTLGTVWEI